MKLLFFDLETTGTNPGKHGIHQISGQIVIDGIVKESFDFHVHPNPKAIIEDEALAVAGVTREQIARLFDMTPRIEMEFNEKPILFREVADYSGDEVNSKVVRTLWENRQYGDTNQGDANFRLYGKGSNFNQAYVYTDKICPTLASKKTCLIHFDKPLYLGQSEVCCISSFPQDYNFAGQQPHYVCGMSVPPVMMAQVASRIYDYWLSKI